MNHKLVGARLSVMMFLQFFVWGAWFVTVGNFMSKQGMTSAIHWAYTVGPIAGIVSPFFLGMVADRFFAAERVLSVLHLAGGAFLLCVPLVVREGGSSLPLILVLLLHCLCYYPTLGLVNTLSFHNLANQEKQFPLVRVFGTIGWIVANWVVSKGFDQGDQRPVQFYVGGISSIVLGLYCLTLPHTPPAAAGKRASVSEVLGLQSLVLFRSPSFVVFIISSFLVVIPLSAYYAYAPVFLTAAGFHQQAFVMSFGQVSEIFFMLVMPMFFARLGVKWMLLVGMLAWVTRYGLFSAAAADAVHWMIFLGILLHGICYDFFFVTGQIYVDKKAPKEIRGQAQGFLVLVTLGLGMLVGAQVAGRIFNRNASPEAASVVAQAEALRADYKDLEKRVDDGGTVTEAEWAAADVKWRQSIPILMKAYDWRTIWLIPCVGAGVIMLLFALLFRDDGVKEVSEEDVAKGAAVEELP